MFKDCFANFDASTGYLSLGNDRIEKVMQVKGSLIRTARITDRVNGKVWDGGKPQWLHCPVLDLDETPTVRFETIAVEDELFVKPHLKAVLEMQGKSGTAWYEYVIFPDVPFVYSQTFVEAKGKIEVTSAEAAFENSVGIENSQPKKAEGDVICDPDTLDSIPLGYSLLEVENFLLFDKTDNNDSLVERQTIPLYKNGRCEREGNLFRISDWAKGDSLFIVKHAPTHTSAINRHGKDLILKGTSYASLMGSGVDFANLPEGRVPYYASAIGACKTEELSHEFYRYNDAFSTGDQRGELFIMSNTWGDRSQDLAICESFIMKELDRAHELGVDILQIDDGWEAGITSNSLRKQGGVWSGFYAYDNNFWVVDEKNFPNGLEPVLEKAKSLGIEIGLWFAPDTSNDFANYEKDIETLMGLYEKYGIRYFKFDGVFVGSKLGEMRFIYLMEELTKRTKGDMRFNLDVTASDRFGYVYQPKYGTLFVENRYTDWANYFPHNTFKNLWNLASVTLPRRLQMELLNNRRNLDKYQGLPFEPSLYGMDYEFAVVMPANPLVWMEMQNLPDEDAEVLAKISAVYKAYKKDFYNSHVIPIGNAPNGMTFSGYYMQNPEDRKSGHVLLFRESAEADTFTFDLGVELSDAKITKIYESAPCETSVNGKSLTVKFDAQRSFVWLKID